MASSVDFPAPFGPISPVRVPFRTWIDTPSTAWTPPNSRTTSTVSSTTSVDAARGTVGLLPRAAGALLKAADPGGLVPRAAGPGAPLCWPAGTGGAPSWLRGAGPRGRAPPARPGPRPPDQAAPGNAP